MEDRKNHGLDSKEYTVRFLLSDGTTKDYENTFSDAMFQYVTVGSALTNVSSGTLNTSLGSTSTIKNFYYIYYNGLTVLRSGSEDIADVFYGFYKDLASKFLKTTLIIMILGILFLVGSQGILIPIVFNVHKTNNRVLSLFGKIPLTEIKELSVKCENFMQKNLEDNNDKRDDNDED